MLKTAVVEERELNKKEPWFDAHFPNEDYDVVFVASDGLTSFYEKVNTGTSKHTAPVNILNVLEVLFDVNDYRRAGFLRLQRSWAFKRATRGTFVQRNWHNADDCSVGCLHVE
jgi:hypothetical protein